MLALRSGLRLSFLTAGLVALVTSLAAAPQDPFQNAQSPGANLDGNAAEKSPGGTDSAAKSGAKANSEPEFVWKTNEEWRRILTYEQFVVTRLKGTEAAFSGKYSRGHYRGTFLCACCGAELFDAEHKFESGTGWPSFWRPIDEKAVGYAIDNSEAEVRTEVMCRRCGAHLGHVFDDGPPPTGQRYCMNSVALRLRPLGGGAASQPSRGKSKAKAKSKAKTTLKVRTKNVTPAKPTTESSPSAASQAPDRKASGEQNRPPSVPSDRP